MQIESASKIRFVCVKVCSHIWGNKQSLNTYVTIETTFINNINAKNNNTKIIYWN